MIQCQICQREFAMLTNTHLKRHALSLEEYRSKFPNALIVDEETKRQASERAKLLNLATKGKKRPDIGAKIAQTKAIRKAAGIDYGVKLRGREKSEETKAKLSESVKRSYRSGERHHWAIGKSISTETRKKISTGLKLALGPEVAIRRARRALEREATLTLRLKAHAEQRRLLNTELDKKHITLIEKENNRATLLCKICNAEWSITSQFLNACKRDRLACRTCTPKLTTSKGELEVFEFVRSLCPDAINGDRVVLGGRELDVLIPSVKIAFEFNGLYWHSELTRGSPNHLLWKQQHAYKQGYHVFHIFEDEWLHKRTIVEDRIKAILGKLERKIDARKTTVVKLTNSEKNAFLEANHLQGSDIAGLRYGLKLGAELVACATFKKTSYVKGGTGLDFELSRFATLGNCSVRGGASRLIKAFITDTKAERLISYADRRWSFGGLYANLGFKFEHFSPPNYWYTKDYRSRTHRAAFMKHELVKAGYDKAKTEWEIMQDRGYDRVWDCGTLKYVLFCDDISLRLKR